MLYSYACSKAVYYSLFDFHLNYAMYTGPYPGKKKFRVLHELGSIMQIGFDNYHTLVACDLVPCQNFSIHDILGQIPKTQKGYIKCHTVYPLIFLTIFPKLALI